MLSIGNVSSAGAASHYFSKDNYYTKEDGLGASQWFGKGAVDLKLIEKADGLERDEKGRLVRDKQTSAPQGGKVDPDVFKAVLEGHVGDDKRVGFMGRDGEWKHVPGKDLTFAPSKSVSIMALVGKDERIVEAFEESVRETLAYAETHHLGVQDRKDGSHSHQHTGKMVAALFTHDTNRNKEPLLHVHAIVANVTMDPRTNEWRSVDKRAFYENRYTLSRMQDALLSKKLERLGYTIEPGGKHGKFEIQGVPDEVIKFFSSRRQEILDHLGTEEKTWGQRQTATYATRNEKSDLTRDQLRADWLDKSLERGFDPAKNIPERRGPIPKKELMASSRALRDAIAITTSTKTTVGHDELVTSVLENPNFRSNITKIEEGITKRLERGILVEHKDSLEHNKIYTTAEHLRSEKQILEMYQTTKGEAPILARTKKLEKRLVAEQIGDHGTFRLNAGQQAAALHILTSPDRYIGIQGLPGVGKTTAIGATVDALKAAQRWKIFGSKYRVVGMAPTTHARDELAKASGKDAITLQRYLSDYASIANGRNPTRSELRMWKNAIIVLDEHSLVSHSQEIPFMKINDALGVKKVAGMGDTAQHEAPDAGVPFRFLQEVDMNTAIIDEMMRQKTPELQAIAHASAHGEFKRAFEASKDLTHSGDDYIDAAAKTYVDALAETDRSVLLVTPDNRTKRAVNIAVRAELQSRDLLKPDKVVADIHVPTYLDKITATYADSYAKGDLLQFNRTINNTPIKEGSVWTVERGDAKHDGSLDILQIRNGDQRFSWSLQSRKKPVFEHLKPDRIPLAVGEKVEFKKTSKQHDVEHNQKATLVTISAKTFTFRLEDGRSIQLNHDDPLARRIDFAHARTSFAGQGGTADTMIAVARHGTQASNGKAMNIIFTRAKTRFQLFTNDRQKLLTTVLSNLKGDRIASKIALKQTIDHLNERNNAGLDRNIRDRNDARDNIRENVQAPIISRGEGR